MTALPNPSAFALDGFLDAQERKSLLRFITCGSVDDGKSTLIGRLLYETKLLFEDQIAALEKDSARAGTQAGTLDFALLVDGLAAEREQGITIDVAYRFFTTEKRKFIVADTPGHEQYTRNMATGASTADAALILVDARKGPTPQTRRHSLIVSMLGVRNVVVVVNKMDLVGWSAETFAAIERDYRAFAAGLGFDNVAFVPACARDGDNVVARSANAPWYTGPTLLDYLETVETGAGGAARPFRLAVQWVNRPSHDFRGYAGEVSGGDVQVGMPVVILPSGRQTRIAGIVTYDGPFQRAVPGQAVTLTLADEVDVSRGDVIAALDGRPHVAAALDARVLWMGETPLQAGASYLVKLGTRSVNARITRLDAAISLDTLEPEEAASLPANAVGDIRLEFDAPVAFDAYADAPETGSFILIDRDTFDTVGMGLVQVPQAIASGSRIAASGFLPQPLGRRLRSLVKALSWRAVASLATLAIAYLVTGSWALALAISGAEIALKTLLYYGHERLWARLPFGLARDAGERAPSPS